MIVRERITVITTKTKQIDLRLPGWSLTLAVVDDLAALVEDPTDEDQVPCWAEVWPSARALAGYIIEGPALTGWRVLELGAGMGVPGMAAAAKGGQVTLTDYQAPALELAARNAHNNRLKVQCCLADWRAFSLQDKFDLVLASDILYDPKFFPYLLEICDQNLQPAGKIMIAHPGRPDTYIFLEQLRQRLRLEERVLEIPIEIEDPYFPYYQIKIHELQRLDC